MREQEKKRQRIYYLLNAETNTPQKISEIIAVSLWPPSNPDLNPLDYNIWGVLENKTKATFYQNIGSLKTAIEEVWNKMSEKFIMKICKSFRWYVNTIIEKISEHIEKIYFVLSLFLLLHSHYTDMRNVHSMVITHIHR